jgi:hypothetical protein
MRTTLRWTAGLCTAALAASVALTGCAKALGIDTVADTIDEARKTIAAQSDAWREELRVLSADLAKMESEVAADAKEVVTSAANQVAELTEQTVALTDAKIQDRIAQAGAEFRCNGDFVRESVTTELQYLVDDLKFWQQEKKRDGTPPPHQNCWVTPTVLSLYPAADGQWSVDPANMSDAGVIHMFGYGYRSDAMPTVTLETGSAVRDATIKTAYVTRYQVNLDIATEAFEGVQAGSQLVLTWPDRPDDSTTITLVPRPPAALQIQGTTFSSTSPRAGGDPVTVTVKVANTGGDTARPFNVAWVPDSSPGTPVYSVTYDQSLRAGESVEVPLGPHSYAQAGDVYSTVSITGADTKMDTIHVLPPPPKLSGSFGTGDDCDEIAYTVQHNAVPAGLIEFRLEHSPKVTWYKGLAVPTTTGRAPTWIDAGNLGSYRVLEIDRGTTEVTQIAVAELDRDRPIRFGKGKGTGGHYLLHFAWNGLSPDVIDPLDGSRVAVTWVKDDCR